MQIKDFKPKYKTIELIISNDSKGNSIDLKTLLNVKELPFDEVVKKYGDYEVLSVKDYEDTKSTSLIIYKEK